jgi:hypothetical protein
MRASPDPWLPRFRLALVIACIASAELFAMPPPPPFIYIVGREVGRDVASNSRDWIGDGIPDTWLRLVARNLGFYLGKPGGYYAWTGGVQAFILRTKSGYPYRQWDTIPNSSYPVLQVVYKGRRINQANGSIANFHPPGDEPVDLYIGDDGLVAMRHTPLEFLIITLDGTYRRDVDNYNLWDNKSD